MRWGAVKPPTTSWRRSASPEAALRRLEASAMAVQAPQRLAHEHALHAQAAPQVQRSPSLQRQAVWVTSRLVVLVAVMLVSPGVFGSKDAPLRAFMTGDADPRPALQVTIDERQH